MAEGMENLQTTDSITFKRPRALTEMM